ncbi:MAG: efflux RND transporter periplasmic adaptor subunit [Pirellula sp.]
MTTPNLLQKPSHKVHQHIGESIDDELNVIDSMSVESPKLEKTSQTTTYGWTILGALVLMAASFAAGRWLELSQAHSDSKLTLSDVPVKNPATNSVVVTAEPVVMRPVQRTIEAVGTLHGFEELVVSSKLEGRVVRIHHDMSSVVRPNELLLELDSTDARLTAQQSERSLQAEMAKWGFRSVPSDQEDLSSLPNVVTAKLRFDLAKSKLNRFLPLQLSNSVSADDLEQAKSEAQIAESEWRNQKLVANAALATVRLKAADLEIAQQRLRDCEIRAPQPTIADRIDDPTYSISERMVSEGTMLRMGTELFRLVLGKTLKLRLSIPESYSSRICVGQSVSVTSTSSIEALMGKVSKIAPSVDRATRTFMVEVEVPNESRVCKPGGFAKASIRLGASEQAVTVPTSSVYSLAGIQKVFLIEKELAREYVVTTGEQTRDWIEIVSPRLPADGQVVTSGQRLLSDGIAVTLRTEEEVDGNTAEVSAP